MAPLVDESSSANQRSTTARASLAFAYAESSIVVTETSSNSRSLRTSRTKSTPASASASSTLRVASSYSARNTNRDAQPSSSNRERPLVFSNRISYVVIRPSVFAATKHLWSPRLTTSSVVSAHVAPRPVVARASLADAVARELPCRTALAYAALASASATSREQYDSTSSSVALPSVSSALSRAYGTRASNKVFEHLGTLVSHPSARAPPPVTCSTALTLLAWIVSTMARIPGSIGARATRRRAVKCDSASRSFVQTFASHGDATTRSIARALASSNAGAHRAVVDACARGERARRRRTRTTRDWPSISS